MALLAYNEEAVIERVVRAAAVEMAVVSVSPTFIGAGFEAVGSLGVERVADGIRLVNRSVCLAGDDVLMAFDVAGAAPAAVP